MKIQQYRQSYTSFRCPFCKGIAYTVRQTADEHNDRQCRLFHHRLKTAAYAFGGVSACAEPHAESERIVFAPFLRIYDTFSLFRRRFCPRGASCRVRTYRFCPFFTCLRYVLTLSVAFLPARSLMHSQNVSFLPLFHGFTIRSHFSCGGSAHSRPQAESERIVFARFLWVYDTFSLFLRRFCLRGASCTVRTYRFCPFFTCLRYVFTFSATVRAARSLMRSQNVSFLPLFHGFTIRSHFSGGVSCCAEPHAQSERIVFVHFLWVYDTFSLFLRRFCPRGTSCRVRTYRFCLFFMGLRYVFTFPVPFLPARSLMRTQNVSFLLLFCGFTIRSHFSCGVSGCAGLPAGSERIVFAPFLRVYDTFSLRAGRCGRPGDSERIAFTCD